MSFFERDYLKTDGNIAFILKQMFPNLITSINIYKMISVLKDIYFLVMCEYGDKCFLLYIKKFLVKLIFIMILYICKVLYLYVLKL